MQRLMIQRGTSTSKTRVETVTSHGKRLSLWLNQPAISMQISVQISMQLKLQIIEYYIDNAWLTAML